MPNMRSFLTVSKAAAFLGVAVSTIRNWDRSGKLKAIRHPVNNYRLYDRDELQALLDRISRNNSSTEKRSGE